MKSEIINFINRVEWTFAKTFAKTSPHDYVVKDKLSEDDQKMFEKFVMFIRENGCRKKYKKSYYTHLDLNGYSYWTMGAPLDITIIINRHRLGFYDYVADGYDELYDAEQFRIENEQIARVIEPAAVGSILDIGCGTGLLLDMFPDRKNENYVGVDPSRKMLEKLKSKHPGADVIHSTFEDLKEFGQFDFVTSLFGGISYVNPDSFGKLKAMVKGGGKYFLMFYKKGYTPVLYGETGMTFSHFSHDKKFLTEVFGKVEDYSNYWIASNI
jgi:SAM-dependent methyltransferase